MQIKKAALLSMLAGGVMSALAVLVHLLGIVAEDHGAIGSLTRNILYNAVFLLEWPAILMRSIAGPRMGLMYYHSHVRGIDFWLALRDHFMVNGVGWATVIFVALAIFLRFKDKRQIEIDPDFAKEQGLVVPANEQEARRKKEAMKKDETQPATEVDDRKE